MYHWLWCGKKWTKSNVRCFSSNKPLMKCAFTKKYARRTLEDHSSRLFEKHLVTLDKYFITRRALCQFTANSFVGSMYRMYYKLHAISTVATITNNNLYPCIRVSHWCSTVIILCVLLIYAFSHNYCALWDTSRLYLSHAWSLDFYPLFSCTSHLFPVFYIKILTYDHTI